jgi:hypothetical protein
MRECRGRCGRVEARCQNGADGDETEMNGLREQGMHVADGDWVSRMAIAKARQRMWIDRREKAREASRVPLSGSEDKRA